MKRSKRTGHRLLSIPGNASAAGQLRLEGFRFNSQGEPATGRRKPARIVILILGGQRAIRFEASKISLSKEDFVLAITPCHSRPASMNPRS